MSTVHHWYEFGGPRLHAELDDGGLAPEKPLALILPGFWRRAASPALAPLTAALHQRGLRVMRIDSRGHGLSEGTYTFGHDETGDLAALLCAIRQSINGSLRHMESLFILGASAAIVSLTTRDAR